MLCTHSFVLFILSHYIVVLTSPFFVFFFVHFALTHRSAAAAVLFPRDHIFMRLTYVPIPFAVAMYAVIDLSSMFLDPNSEVGHAGHVGGFLMGAAYVAALWRFKRINGVTAAQRFGKELPIQAWFKNRPNPIGFIRSAAPAGPPPMH